MRLLRLAVLALFVLVSLTLLVAGIIGAVPEDLAGLIALGGLATVFASGMSYSVLSIGGGRTLRGIVGALPGAVVVGSGLRVMMRTVAVSSGLTPSFSFGGTFFIFSVSLIPSMFLGMGYLYFRRFLPGGGLVKGALYGVAIGFLLGLPIMWLAGSELSLARDLTIPVITFMGLPVIYGLTLDICYRLLRT